MHARLNLQLKRYQDNNLFYILRPHRLLQDVQSLLALPPKSKACSRQNERAQPHNDPASLQRDVKCEQSNAALQPFF